MEKEKQRFLCDPLIISALEAHGQDIENLVWDEIDEGGEKIISLLSNGSAPQVYLSEDGVARMSWQKDFNEIASYLHHRDGDSCIITIENMKTPEILLTSIIGKPLNLFLDVPGASQVKVINAINTRRFNSDPYSTRIKVERMEFS